MSDDPFLKEYYALLDSVKDYDKTFLTVKGWAVTLSLAALGLGFQYQHSGFFLIAALSGMAFWSIEGIMKRYQMRYYVRMREIEVLKAEEAGADKPSSPQVDWSWNIAPAYLIGKKQGALPPPEHYQGKWTYNFPWTAPHIALPHAISVLAGSLLYLLSLFDIIKMPL